ncbi:MAG: pirin family protein [Bacteroidetes bacterium]|nr:pirin family protein [Bacteroidota bacterium]
MKRIHRSVDRGSADHGWLKARHSFSFAGYHDPNKMNFGVLRVLNDDIIEGGQGFGAHPHENMEIVSIILQGALAHKDSNGNEHVSYKNGLQVMSAGTGIHHSEYNGSDFEITNLLQLWVFPDRKGHTPRYDQSDLNDEEMNNKLCLAVGPKESDAKLWINQKAYFSLGNFEEGVKVSYKKYLEENGLYLFVIDGSLTIAGETLARRDAIGLDGDEDINLEFTSDSKILIIDLPMLV